MAGSLVLIQETTVSTSVASVSLTGIDSTFNIYKVVYDNLGQVNDNTNTSIRFIDSSGSAISDSDYDVAQVNMCSDTSFRNLNGQNSDKAFIVEAGGNNTNELSNGVLYIFNANNSSEYTFFTIEGNYTNTATDLRGGQGGGVLTSAEQVTGIQFFIDSGNIDAGTFKLYGLKK
jgi:hypothetical protein